MVAATSLGCAAKFAPSSFATSSLVFLALILLSCSFPSDKTLTLPLFWDGVTFLLVASFAESTPKYEASVFATSFDFETVESVLFLIEFSGSAAFLLSTWLVLATECESDLLFSSVVWLEAVLLLSAPVFFTSTALLG